MVVVANSGEAPGWFAEISTVSVGANPLPVMVSLVNGEPLVWLMLRVAAGQTCQGERSEVIGAASGGEDEGLAHVAGRGRRRVPIVAA